MLLKHSGYNCGLIRTIWIHCTWCHTLCLFVCFDVHVMCTAYVCDEPWSVFLRRAHDYLNSESQMLPAV